MKAGDKVIPRGFPNSNRPGTVQRVLDRKAEVTWIMGSGWNHTVEHDIDELEVQS